MEATKYMNLNPIQSDMNPKEMIPLAIPISIAEEKVALAAPRRVGLTILLIQATKLGNAIPLPIPNNSAAR